MSVYSKTVEIDAEFSPVNPKKDAREALMDLSVEELRISARATLGASAWISIARKEQLIDALVDGKLPAANMPAIAPRVPVNNADLAELLAQSVARYMPKAGVDEKAVEDIVHKAIEPEVSKMDHKLHVMAVEFKHKLDQISKSNSATQIEQAIRGASEAIHEKVSRDHEARYTVLRADCENIAARAIDAKMDSMGDAITVKLQKRMVKEIVVKRLDGTKIPVGAQHEQFPELLQVLGCGLNVFLVGPAASGKTRATEEAAKALDLKFYPQSFNAQTPSSQIFGYMDAQGKYVSTVFREAFEKGGLWLADEIDRGNGNVLTALNAALENGYCSFPDGVVKRHEKFLCVASANTWGRGADRTYVGANALDEATLDRFTQMEWHYDEALERLLAANSAWVDRVQGIRSAVFEERVRLLVSPRASIRGAKLLAAGLKWSRVEELTLWKGADKATREKVLARAPKLVTRIQIEGA